jgi:uncharacterized damage-inducible protein DinB
MTELTPAAPAAARLPALLAELAQETGTTRRVLERVPEDRLGWRPHAKSYTMGQLARHVATLPAAIAQLAAQGSLDVTKGDPRPEPASVAELLATHDECVARAASILGAMDDATLDEPWTLTNGDQELLRITRGQLLRTILFNHVYHHRGALTVYLRLNDVPVPAIYGPSADEMPSFG